MASTSGGLPLREGGTQTMSQFVHTETRAMPRAIGAGTQPQGWQGRDALSGFKDKWKVTK